MAATIVLIPGAPLGLIIEGVQALAGVLLPSATVFLLMLCNDRAVLGPWVNRRGTNVFASAVIALLIAVGRADRLGRVARYHRPADHGHLSGVHGGGGRRGRLDPDPVAAGHSSVEVDRRDRENWRMPPLNMLTKPVMSAGRKVALAVLGSYMVIAMVLVIVRIIQMALGN